MTISPLPREDDEPFVEKTPGQSTNVWEVLREQRERVADHPTFDLVVAGTKGLLALRLGPLPGSVQSTLAARYQRSKSPDRDFNFAADALINACEAIVSRAHPGDPWREEFDDAGEPVRVDDRLASKLDMPDPGNARAVLVRLFAGTPSPELAIRAASNDYSEWAANAVDDEDLGE